MSQRHICSDCGARGDEPGDCERCGEGPLLDLDGEGNAELLRQADRDRAERRRGRLTMVAVPLGIAGGVGLSYVVPGLLPIPFGRVIQAVVVMVVVAYGSLRLLALAFPPEVRFPYLAEEPSFSVRGAAGDMRRQELKKPILVVALLCVVGVVIGGLSWWQKTVAAAEALEQQRQAGQAWADLEQCLVGEPIVTHDDLVAALRSVELAGGRSESEDGWPRRCGRHVSALYQSLDGKRYGAGLKLELEERFACAKACVVDQPAEQMAGVADRVRALPILAATPSVDPPPRLAAELLGKQDFPQLAAGDAVLQDRDVLEEGTVRLLFNSRGRGLSACEIHPDRADAVACRDLHLPLSSGTVQLAVGSEELVLSGRQRADDEDQLYTPAGDVITPEQSKGEGVLLTKLGGRSWKVARLRGGEIEAEEKLKLSKGASDPWVVAGQLAWVASDDDEPAFHVRSLSGEELLGESKRVGALADNLGGARSCRDGERAAVLFGGGPESWRVATFDGKAWSDPATWTVPASPDVPPADAAPESPAAASGSPSAPKSDVQAARQAALRDAAEHGMIGLLSQKAGAGSDASPWPTGVGDNLSASRGNMWGDSVGGGLSRSARGRDRGARDAPKPRPRRRPETKPLLPRRPFTCGGEAAYVTWRQPSSGGQRIVQRRCDRQGCRDRAVDLAGMAVKEMWLAATLIADDGQERVLLVWRTPVGDLRMRLAPLDELPRASDRLLMDSADHGGPATVDLQAFLGRAAVVFLFRGTGIQALRVDADGEVTPLG